MKNKAKATPRPWRISGEDEYGRQIIKHARPLVLNQPYEKYENRYKPIAIVGITKANARLIVKAVNAYDELLEACKTAIFGLTTDVEINKTNPKEACMFVADLLSKTIQKAEGV